ncbi:unnamed protein product [Caenorhabditis sp. 36 PRJEB53466]|nr:unnamed protein product [Caenorhabditis sp. 36 PRJEB53466]
MPFSEEETTEKLFAYKYIDLEGEEYGPYDGTIMAKWDEGFYFDNDVIVFRISIDGKAEEFKLGDLRKIHSKPFLVPESSKQQPLEEISEKEKTGEQIGNSKKAEVIVKMDEQESQKNEIHDAVQVAVAEVVEQTGAQITESANQKIHLASAEHEKLEAEENTVKETSYLVAEQEKSEKSLVHDQPKELHQAIEKEVEPGLQTADVNKTIAAEQFKVKQNQQNGKPEGRLQIAGHTAPQYRIMQSLQSPTMPFMLSYPLNTPISIPTVLLQMPPTTAPIAKIPSRVVSKPVPVVPSINADVLAAQAKPFNPELYSSPPLMRLSDPGSVLMKPDVAHRKLFILYQMIITIPEKAHCFSPYSKEIICCQFCKVNLAGFSMFTHLVNCQHMGRLSSCVFSTNDVDFWIDRVQDVIRHAPTTALTLPGFTPDVLLNTTDSVADFINRTKGFTRKLTVGRVVKQSQFLDVTADVMLATQYVSTKALRPKSKLTGVFLSEVVENLIGEVDKKPFLRHYGKLHEKYNDCKFCNIKMSTFYDFCAHIGSQLHRENTSMMLYHEGVVGSWVRLLATPKKQNAEPQSTEPPAKKPCEQIEVITID